MFGRSRFQNGIKSSVTHVDRIKRRGAMGASLIVLFALAAIPATAAPTQKTFTPTAAPSCIPTGVSTAFTFTLKNTMPPGGQSFGSVNIGVPSQITAALTPGTFTFANPITNRNWTASFSGSGSTIQLRSAGSSDAIPPQGSITLNFSVTGNTAGLAPWTPIVKQSNDFRGTNNQFSLTSGADNPVTTVGSTCISLGCADSPITIGDPGTQATIDNIATGDGCTEPVVFTATFDGDQFEILKPDGEQVRLRIDLNAWNPEPAHNPVPATTVKPPLPGGEPGVWCNGTPTSFSMPGLPGVHSWCLIEQRTQPAGVQQMQVYESWLLQGDALACRTCR